MSDTLETTAGAKSSARWSAKWGNVLGRFLALMVVFAFFAIAVDGGKFYTARNLENILRQSCVYATAGLGMTIVIIAAGIDLSAGSLIALSVVAVAWLLNLNVPCADGQELSIVKAYPVMAPILAVLAGIAAATLAGMI